MKFSDLVVNTNNEKNLMPKRGKVFVQICDGFIGTGVNEIANRT